MTDIEEIRSGELIEAELADSTEEAAAELSGSADDAVQAESAPEPDYKAARKRFSRIGIALFVYLVGTSLMQLGLKYLMLRLHPGDAPDWFVWVYAFAPMYLVALPICLLMLRRIPCTPIEKKRLGFGWWCIAALIGFFLMYAGNIAGTLVTAVIGLFKSGSAVNPVMNLAMNDALLLKLAVMVVVGPIVEEYIFRKMLIDRMNVYGGKLAVVTSALLFGLFHGNFSQFFYAFALGLLFGYLYLKTGRIRNSIFLHMLLNFNGGVLAPYILKLSSELSGGVELAASEQLWTLLPKVGFMLIYMNAVIGAAVSGLVMLCVHKKRVSYSTAAQELPKGRRFGTVWLTAGMILNVLACLTLFAVTVIR